MSESNSKPQERAIVLDAPAFIAGTESLFSLRGLVDVHSGAPLQSISRDDPVTFYTIPDVINEVRDARARARLSLLQGSIKLRVPSPEALDAVVQFSKHVGDFSALSMTDLKVIALTWMLEREVNGGVYLKSVPHQPRVTEVRIGHTIPFEELDRLEAMADLQLDDQHGNTLPKDDAWHTVKYSTTNKPIEPKLEPKLEPKPEPKPESHIEAVTHKSENETIVNHDVISLNNPTSQRRRRRRHGPRKPRTPQPQQNLSTVNPNESHIDQNDNPVALVHIDSKKEGHNTDDHFTPLNAIATTTDHVHDTVTKPVTNESENESSVKDNHIPLNNTASQRRRRRGHRPRKPRIPQPQQNLSTVNTNESHIDQNDKPAALVHIDSKKEEHNIDEHFTPLNAIATTSPADHIHDTVSTHEDLDGSQDADEGRDSRWINEENLEEHLAHDRGGELSDGKYDRVACVTTDFAMQNTMLQMGLKLLSVDGRRAIRKIRHYAIRCQSCGIVTTDLERKFCDRCGNACFHRVSYKINKEGTARAYLNPKKKPSLRGTKYPIPMPKGGRHNIDLVLREDQIDSAKQRRLQKQRERLNADVLDPSNFYNAGARFDPYNKPLVIGYGKRNPNEVRGCSRGRP